ncbi:MAG: type II 3-dehydroquinate dehydratase [Pelagibacterales bacterium]|nr:type II 3-dehydroquinate dehydratase [Pelagibacterales bacterium]|tara:strand:+ start:4381 stop:4833 length:453 start_codon:yes stop_codon:yes gene_type:complete
MNKLSKILVINGPNLNFLGKREKDFYGSITLKEIENKLKKIAKNKKININFFQSNSEGKLIDIIQDATDRSSGIIINAGGYSHTSVAIMDALKVYNNPIIEVHMSNIYAREEFRNYSYISSVVDGSICGLGYLSYEIALDALIKLINLEK